MTTNKQQQRFLGGVEQGYLAVDTNTGPITIGEYDALIDLDTSTGAISNITLPSTPPVGTSREHVFMDVGGQAVVNNITILAPALGSINGAVSVTINANYGGVTLSTEDGLNYTIIACCGTIMGAFALTSFLTPPQITADQNDYAPTGFAGAAALRLDTDAAWSMTGLSGGSAGRMIWIYYVGAQSLTLNANNAGSAAANQFGFDADVILINGTGLQIQYDPTSLLWRKAAP